MTKAQHARLDRLGTPAPALTTQAGEETETRLLELFLRLRGKMGPSLTNEENDELERLRGAFQKP